MDANLVIIKLGGAAISHKQQFETLNDAVLACAASHISQLHRNGVPIVIVHGAGSFGHHQATQGGLALGGSGTAQEVAACVAATHASVVKLNSLVVQQLTAHGVPAVGLPAFGLWSTQSREVVRSHGCSAAHSLLQAGLVPVLHGDVAIDTVQGFCILSGDKILTELCKYFAADGGDVVAVFMTNVAGIYDRPPETAGATLIRSVQVSPQGAIVKMLDSRGGDLGLETSSSHHDSTGGMRGKVEEAVAAAQHARVVRIVQAGAPAALQACTFCKEMTLDPSWPGTEVFVGSG